MRTTIDIEDDVLAATKELARLQNVSAGYIVSKLIREALAGQRQTQVSGKPVAGFRPFPARGTLITNGQVDELRDQEGI
jgi:hypothetical protein